MFRIFKNVKNFRFFVFNVAELFSFEESCINLIAFYLKNLIKTIAFQITSSISKEKLILIKSNEINVTFWSLQFFITFRIMSNIMSSSFFNSFFTTSLIVFFSFMFIKRLWDLTEVRFETQMIVDKKWILR